MSVPPEFVPTVITGPADQLAGLRHEPTATVTDSNGASWRDQAPLQHGQATNGMGTALCGNPRHPDGPWHRATPPPFYPGWLARHLTRRGRAQQREVVAYEWRRAAWGCGCRVTP